MLVVPNLSPRAITTGKDIADFTENKLNSIRAGLRHYSAMVGYTLVSQLDAAGYTEQYDKDRIEQTLKRRVYHMPMGVFDYSISARVPVMVLKAPIDFANELSQNVLPSIIQSALAAGEKPDMYNIVNYGFKQMMREGTYGHSDESTSGLERLHGFYTESRAFDNDKRLMNPLHPVEKKSVRELNKYEMKQILSVIGLPATRENRFW